MRIVAIAAFHRPFEHLVVEGQLKLVLGLAVTTHAQLRFTGPEQFHTGDTGFLRVCWRDEHVGSRHMPARFRGVARVAIRTTDVVAPVFATAEVVMFLFACVTTETCFGSFFCRLVLEGNDLRGIAFFNVLLAGSVARLATRHLILPTPNFCKR